MPPKAAPSGAKASNGAKVAPLTAAAESRVAWGDADPDAAIPTEELAEGLRSEAEAAALKAAQFDLDGLAVKPQPRSSQHGKHQMQPPPPMPPPTPPKPYGRTGHVIHLQHLVCVLTLLIVGLVAGLTASLASVPSVTGSQGPLTDVGGVWTLTGYSVQAFGATQAAQFGAAVAKAALVLPSAGGASAVLITAIAPAPAAAGRRARALLQPATSAVAITFAVPVAATPMTPLALTVAIGSMTASSFVAAGLTSCSAATLSPQVALTWPPAPPPPPPAPPPLPSPPPRPPRAAGR